MGPSRALMVRMSESAMRDVDYLVKQLRKREPQRRWSRSEALREALHRVVEGLRHEQAR